MSATMSSTQSLTNPCSQCEYCPSCDPSPSHGQSIARTCVHGNRMQRVVPGQKTHKCPKAGSAGPKTAPKEETKSYGYDSQSHTHRFQNQESTDNARQHVGDDYGKLPRHGYLVVIPTVANDGITHRGSDVQGQLSLLRPEGWRILTPACRQ